MSHTASDAARAGGPAAEYLDRLLTSITCTAMNMPQIVTAAEVCAQRLAAGGTLWVSGSHRGFPDEAVGRAGGMIVARGLPGADALRRGDVVLIGAVVAHDAGDRELLHAAERRGALAVLFAPRNTAGSHLYVNPYAEATQPDGSLPTISPAIATSLWAFTGELVSALTRRGKMPPIYQSILVPGGTERNSSRLALPWEPEAPAAIPPIVLGRTYVARLANCLRAMRATQMDRFAAAGQLGAQTLGSGHTVWHAMTAHMPPYEPGLPGDPGLTQALPPNAQPDVMSGKVRAGDLVLYLGYYEPFGPWVERARELGARIVTVVAGTPELPADQMGADICIGGCWPFGDSLVDVPGYDVKVLPSSGVIQSAAYWMLVGEIAARR